ncbi:MAG TPA: hypothetical protein ENK44_14175 [Caldithrix abyssi]|uniref:ATP synthase subunit I n=1 Tax=Caldithrix abyssi TaxID=187145 RepID=A0A7V4U2I6_CALAY|nr:hypothetical protein [Caldithrix abyssi]
MSEFLKFSTGVLIVLLIYVFSAWLIGDQYLNDPKDHNALIYAGILATANIVAIFLIIRFTFHKDAKSFNKSFFLGYGIRFGILLIFIFILLSWEQVNNFTFLTALFILYFIYQIWEVVFLNKHFKQDSTHL